MFTKLNEAEYTSVTNLFTELQHLTFCQAVLFGNQRGEIWVDSLENPSAALLLTREMWAFLGGTPENDTFAQAVGKAIIQRDILEQDGWGLILSCTPAWESALDRVFSGAKVSPFPRFRYLLKKADFDALPEIPAGYTVFFIDESLAHKMPPMEVAGVIEMRKNEKDPDKLGFGYVVMYDGVIVAHAVIDSIANGVGDIEVETIEAYRKKGLATIISALTCEYGLSHDLHTINWDCSQQNEASIQTAEKLGFVQISEHMMHFVDL